MMFQQGHRILAGISKDFGLEGLATPRMQDIAKNLLIRTGRQSKRYCPLKPRLVLWLVVALALYRNDSIANVFERLMSWVRDIEPRLCRRAITPEAICHARKRLGASPLKLMFREVVQEGKPVEPTFHGLRVFGIDGSEFTVPDTKKNSVVFGRHQGGRGPGAYPQVKGIFIVDVATHRIRNCSFFPYFSSEVVLLPFLMKDLKKGDLLLLDRGLSSFLAMLKCRQRKANFLFRLSASWKPQFIRKLGKGDTLMRFVACGKVRRRLPPGERDTAFVLRVLEFKVGNGELVRLVTDLVDPWKFPAVELAQLYHQRWECELAYKELKSQLVAVTSSKQQTHFRSKSPVKVLQEAWGMVLAHTLVRQLMLEGAEESKVPPLTLSFTDSLQTIKLALRGFQTVNRKIKHRRRRELIKELGKCLIDRPRRKRQCPRVVRRKMSTFRLKRKGDRASPLDTDIEFVI